ncbi:hypothetical protein RRG08_002295 [Elysia crispata]|uniref:Uncharacterized protein n=1 Tax=Elysia crispata TaxID=231223 RepID=A0AAE0ZAU6_9GAST|nr:hypothetical protein RRG08_002295 [Elysia crispata]
MRFFVSTPLRLTVNHRKTRRCAYLWETADLVPHKRHFDFFFIKFTSDRTDKRSQNKARLMGSLRSRRGDGSFLVWSAGREIG